MQAQTLQNPICSVDKKQINKQPFCKLPTIHEKAAFNQIYIKGQRPLAVYVKHAKKVLQKSNIIFIHGMTSTIVKALKLAQLIRKQFPYMKYSIQSDSVPTIVSFKQESSKDQQQKYELKERSCVHIRMDKNFAGDKN